MEDGADWAIGRAVDVDQYHQIAQAMNGPGEGLKFALVVRGFVWIQRRFQPLPYLCHPFLHPPPLILHNFPMTIPDRSQWGGGVICCVTVTRLLSAGLFAYTILAGGPQAFLVSDVVQCQLGGSQLRYWYFRMEEQSTLDVCIRQPPGPGGKLDCYAGIANTMARQWIYRSIELPPVSQTFEVGWREIVEDNWITVMLLESTIRLRW